MDIKALHGLNRRLANTFKAKFNSGCLRDKPLQAQQTPGLKTGEGWENIRMNYSSCVLLLSLLRHTHMYTYGHHERQYGAGHTHSEPIQLPFCLFLYLYKGSYTHTKKGNISQ